VYYVTYVSEAFFMQDDDVALWVDSGATIYALLCLFITKDEALDKFKVFKTEVELQQVPLIKRFRTDRGGEYMDTLYFQSVSIIYETTTPYTLQQNGIFERKNKDDPKTINETMKSHDVALWKEAIDDEMDSIMGNNTSIIHEMDISII
ncbi:zinc finger, CCHC-type containing protein, partial [Tanacetum coccineum]